MPLVLLVGPSIFLSNEIEQYPTAHQLSINCLNPKTTICTKYDTISNLLSLDELRAEQDHVSTQSKAKHSMEVQLSELEARFAEATDAANRGGRTAMAKLESRIRELEIELGNVQGRTGENQKGYQKAERKIKELSFQIDEDKKNQDRMTELASKLQQKIKTYKKQIEEAEEIAALNLAKFRKAQQELEETEERARLAENALRC